MAKKRVDGRVNNGRPEKPIDWDEVDDLLRAGCLGTEIAARFDMHPDTFYNRVQEKFNMGFTEYSSKKKADGESILRQVQYLKAIGASDKGDNTLLIWLGKNRLNQKETSDISVSAETTKNLVSVMTQLNELQEKPQENKADEAIDRSESCQ